MNYIKRTWMLYLMLVLPLAFFVIFRYIPMSNLVIAFKDYNMFKGVWESPWAGFKWFQKAFATRDFWYAVRNTVGLNLLDLLISFPAPILLAVLLNELAYKHFKRFTQAVVYLPHFLSWIIISGFALQLFAPNTGLVNIYLAQQGREIVDFLGVPNLWVATYIGLGLWQSVGWNTIIYLAAITGINGELYEAATIDGASRLRKIWHVTMPGIRATTVTLLILNLGRIMGSNFERLSTFGNVQVKDFQYQLAIYIYEKGLASGNFSNATAVGLFQSLLGFILVLAADRVAKSLGENGLI